MKVSHVTRTRAYARDIIIRITLGNGSKLYEKFSVVQERANLVVRIRARSRIVCTTFNKVNDVRNPRDRQRVSD